MRLENALGAKSPYPASQSRKQCGERAPLLERVAYFRLTLLRQSNRETKARLGSTLFNLGRSAHPDRFNRIRRALPVDIPCLKHNRMIRINKQLVKGVLDGDRVIVDAQATYFTICVERGLDPFIL
jgi:hypothetical protein